jgi:GT2 family glycosyltransferase
MTAQKSPVTTDAMISALIVTHNSAKWIGRCLELLRAFGRESIKEIIVVDNASTDETLAEVRKFPDVQCIASSANVGFAGGMNLAAGKSTGEALLILNPDTVLRSELTPMVEILKQSPEAAAVAPRLTGVDGNFQRGFAIRRLPTRMSLIFEILLLNRLWPGNPVNRRSRCLDFDPEREAVIEQPAGACLLVRRVSFEAVGGFDESFHPLWFEDVDLCRRLLGKGGTIRYCPEVRVEHAGGHSLETVPFGEKQLYWYRSLLYYVRKHYGWGTGVLIRSALFAGIGLRMFAELIAAVLNRTTPQSVRRQRLRGYWQAAMLSFSAGESRPRVNA